MRRKVKFRIRHDGIKVVPVYLWIPKTDFDDAGKYSYRKKKSKHKVLVDAIGIGVRALRRYDLPEFDKMEGKM